MEINKKVLVVDDEEDLREIIGFELSDAGYDVSTASGGYEALEMTKQEQFAAIVSDIRMPKGTGVELLEGVKSPETLNNPDIVLPVFILISGFADLSIEEAYDKGAEAVFFKPFDEQKLIESIDNALMNLDERWSRHSTRVDWDPRPSHVNFTSNQTGKIVNLGKGGMFVAIDPDQFSVGSRFEFSLALNACDHGMIRGSGIVKWVRRDLESSLLPGVGVEFDLIETGRDDLIRLINESKTNAYIPKG